MEVIKDIIRLGYIHNRYILLISFILSIQSYLYPNIINNALSAIFGLLPSFFQNYLNNVYLSETQILSLYQVISFVLVLSLAATVASSWSPHYPNEFQRLFDVFTTINTYFIVINHLIYTLGYSEPIFSGFSNNHFLIDAICIISYSIGIIFILLTLIGFFYKRVI